MRLLPVHFKQLTTIQSELWITYIQRFQKPQKLLFQWLVPLQLKKPVETLLGAATGGLGPLDFPQKQPSVSSTVRDGISKPASCIVYASRTGFLVSIDLVVAGLVQMVLVLVT